MVQAKLGHPVAISLPQWAQSLRPGTAVTADSSRSVASYQNQAQMALPLPFMGPLPSGITHRHLPEGPGARLLHNRPPLRQGYKMTRCPGLNQTTLCSKALMQ